MIICLFICYSISYVDLYLDYLFLSFRWYHDYREQTDHRIWKTTVANKNVIESRRVQKMHLNNTKPWQQPWLWAWLNPFFRELFEKAKPIWPKWQIQPDKMD